MKNLINRINAIIDAASEELNSKKLRLAGSGVGNHRNLVANGNCGFAASTSYIKRVKVTLNGEETTVEVDKRMEPDLWWLECKPHLIQVGFDITWQSLYLDIAEVTVNAMIKASFDEHIDGGDFGDVVRDIIYFKGVVSHAERWDMTLKTTCLDMLKYYLKDGKPALKGTFRKAQRNFYRGKKS